MSSIEPRPRHNSLRILLMLSCTLLIVFLALIMFAALGGPPPKPSVTVMFAGLTNDAAGSRVATFVVSNASPWTVEHGGHYNIESPNGDRWINLADGWLPGSSLGANSQKMVMLPPPTNQTPWRATFSYRKAEGMFLSLATEVLIEGQKLGIPTRYRRIGHVVRSDVISDEQTVLTNSVRSTGAN